jgi:CheY-like chemotaxis protein
MVLKRERPTRQQADTALTVLVVEDEPLLVYELFDELAQLGHVVVGPVMAGLDVIAAIEERPIDFALVDVHLLDGPTGIDVGRHLSSRGIPYVFLTATPTCLPEDLVGALGGIERPYVLRDLREVLIYLGRVTVGGSIETSIPVSIRTSFGESLEVPKPLQQHCEGSNRRTCNGFHID